MTVRFKVKTGDDYLHAAAEAFQFPGGEWHLRNIAEVRDTEAVWIADWRGADPNDLVRAALFADVAHRRNAPFVLFVPYLPAARADRAFLGEQPVGVKVYADLIRSMNPQQVVAIDVHSEAANRYVEFNFTELSSGPLLRRALGYKNARETGWDAEADHYDAVIAPDKGAAERAAAAAGYLGRFGVDVYHAEKKRDEETGKILDIRMAEKLPPSGRYLVVDDICDGGGTFLGLAAALAEAGVTKECLGLWVTHAIFSGNAPALRTAYDRIYTTDSHPGSNRVGCATTIVPCEIYMLHHLKSFGLK